jgi:hypothetical protein
MEKAMALKRFDLVKSKGAGWELKAGGSVLKKFATKAEAIKAGVLEKALGKTCGTVRIHSDIGAVQEERTYPRSKDPRKSPG